MSIPVTPQGASSPIGELIRREFASRNVTIDEIDIKPYPEETIVVIYVPEEELLLASQVGNSLDDVLEKEGVNGFITVRKSRSALNSEKSIGKFTGVHDPRASKFVQIVQAGGRTSESQPSLAYVTDGMANLARIGSFRHNLIFGRRGAGKTALMVEGKRLADQSGELTIWLNMQPYRQLQFERAALGVVQEVLNLVQVTFRNATNTPVIAASAANMSAEVERELAKTTVRSQYLLTLAPRFQQLLKRFLATSGSHLFVYLDDFYFVPRDHQVELLDVLHSFVRDLNAWLKIATIRNLTRWFDPGTQTGLQIPNDAVAIDLDVTLQDPGPAKDFLETVLKKHAALADVTSIASLFTRESLDRLLLASGAVPRDYLALAGEAVIRAQSRVNARQVGVQDVNKAAGDAAQLKLQELDEDSGSWADVTKAALRTLLRFCLEQHHFTFFRVDFRDRDEHPSLFDQLANLMDLRLIHLLNSSVSDVHHPGEKAEAYLLDMSQYSGDRLRHHLQVLNLRNGHLAVKETGTQSAERVANTQRQLITILRGSPAFPLDCLAG
jgi:hypothetical protein